MFTICRFVNVYCHGQLKVVSYGSEEVAEKAIMVLKDVFTNLGPRLLANQASFCFAASLYCILLVIFFKSSRVHNALWY